MVWSILYNQQSEVFKGDISRGLSSATSQGGAHYLLEAEEIPNPSSYPMAGPWRWGLSGGDWSKSWWDLDKILLLHFFSYSHCWHRECWNFVDFWWSKTKFFRTSIPRCIEVRKWTVKKYPEREHAFWCWHGNPHHFEFFFKWERHLDGDQSGQFL